MNIQAVAIVGLKDDRLAMRAVLQWQSPNAPPKVPIYQPLQELYFLLRSVLFLHSRCMLYTSPPLDDFWRELLSEMVKGVESDGRMVWSPDAKAIQQWLLLTPPSWEEIMLLFEVVSSQTEQESQSMKVLFVLIVNPGTTIKRSTHLNSLSLKCNNIFEMTASRPTSEKSMMSKQVKGPLR